MLALHRSSALRGAGLVLALGSLLGCGSSSAEPPENAPSPPAPGANETSSTAPTEPPASQPAAGATCASFGGACVSKVAAVDCKTWPAATDCGANEGCCVR